MKKRKVLTSLLRVRVSDELADNIESEFNNNSPVFNNNKSKFMRLLLRVGFDVFTLNRDDLIELYRSGKFDDKE
jgi:hypothetical protein